MIRKHAGRKHAAPRKGSRGRPKPRGRRSSPQEAVGETGVYDPNRGEATN